jgi:hypothetical protein
MTNYTDYPFTSNGVNFISRIDNDSPFASRLASLPRQIVDEMNIDAVTQMIGDASKFTTAELLAELERVNEGGTHAFILLGANA